MCEDIKIRWLDVAVVLEQTLERVPTFEEIQKFLQYLTIDISQRLKDNAKSFVRERAKQMSESENVRGGPARVRVHGS